MERRELTRRTVLKGGAAVAGLALLRARMPALAAAQSPAPESTYWPAHIAQDFPSRPGEEVLPWLDQPGENPIPHVVGNLLHWEDLNTWITPADNFFTVKHYDQPSIDPQAWRLELAGLVQNPRSFTLDEIMARPTQEVAFTVECSGNHGFGWNFGLVGNAIWMGTPLAALLNEAGVLPKGSEVVFWGTDTGPAEVNGVQLTEQFSRSMSLEEAMDPRNILCWAMNGETLLPEHGFPLRLIAPGWYGVANVKWLRRIEVLDRPYEGRFMAREYVTIREAEQDGAKIARFTSVGRANLKSAPAKVTQLDGAYRIIGAAWGASIGGVEVRIDDGPWLPATIDEGGEAFAWGIWSLDWDQPADGEHAITTRAIDVDGNIQPAPDDPLIATKLTFWESNGQITRRVRIGAPIDIVLPDAATFTANLSGASEVPGPGDGDGFGYARLVIDPAEQSVCFRISVAGIDAPTAAHIHAGSAGASGPVVVPLTPVDPSGLWNACVTVDAALAAAIVNNPSDYYVNVHTAAYPAGAVRGQLAPIA